jgi:protein-tyrosine phosphatase
MLDLVPPDPASLADAAGAIEALRARGPVLVCCALGFSRSACAIAAWLVSTGPRVRCGARDRPLAHRS